MHRDARDIEQLHATIASLQQENARLWRSYELLKEELALAKRRLFVAKAERVDTSKLQLEFEELLGKLAKLAGEATSTPASDQVRIPSDLITRTRHESCTFGPRRPGCA